MVALGSAIGDFLGQLLRVPLTQVLVHVMDKETQKWIPTIIFYTCKVVAIAVAIHVQKLLSAFYSAVRGGLLVSRNVMYVLDRKGVFKLDPNETYVDEVTGWGAGRGHAGAWGPRAAVLDPAEAPAPGAGVAFYRRPDAFGFEFRGPSTFRDDRLHWNLDRTITTGGWFAGEALQFGGTGPWRKLLLYRE
ncbi:hypothetical protein JL721_4440 [Aureococcus anophagefferens]|nr:hypothetical protein JL721_4440 [Aureococcus anophagefferens]